MSEAPEAGGPLDTPEPAAGGLDAIITTAIETSGYGAEDAPAEAAAETTETVSEGRQRDAQGRFLPKDPAEPDPSPAEPVTAEANPEQPTQPDPAQVQPIEPHPRWSPELKAQFATWSPDVQKAFMDRYGEAEADYTRKTQELAETRKAHEPLIGEVSKWSPYLQQLNIPPEAAFQQMIQAEYTLRNGHPQEQAQGIAHLMQTYRIPVEAVLQTLGISPAAGQDGQPTYDPATTQLRQELSEVRSHLQRFQEQAATSERQRAQAEFDAIGQTKDDSGNPKYPHFSLVKGDMLQLVANGAVDNWQDAYTKAVRLNDDLYRQEVEAERKRVADAAEKARQDAVAKAKKAEPVRAGGTPPGGGTQRKGLDAHLNAALGDNFGG
jgi:hypothetical protein